MGKRLRRQAGQLYEVFVELVRRYQFRDRDSIGCHGISVSQCYSLDALWRSGPLTMGELAAELALEISTMTRIVDHLVEAGLADRQEDAADRRVRRVGITRKGEQLASQIHDGLVAEYEQVLREVPAEHRESVIQAIRRLLSAFQERQRRASPVKPCEGSA
ncbi:MAG: MarR family winged helix-turn-helix transcriptional regulator [Planctomycetota bacterium]|jgi:DNA-binding MarR family transcriptional regulator